MQNKNINIKKDGFRITNIRDNIYLNYINDNKLPHINECDNNNNTHNCNEIRLRDKMFNILNNKYNNNIKSFEKNFKCKYQGSYCAHCNILYKKNEKGKFFLIIYPYENGYYIKQQNSDGLEYNNLLYNAYDGVTVFRPYNSNKFPYSFSLIRNKHYTDSKDIGYLFNCYLLLKKYLNIELKINNTMFLLRQQIFCNNDDIVYREHQHAWLQIIQPNNEIQSDWVKYDNIFIDNGENENRRKYVKYDLNDKKIYNTKSSYRTNDIKPYPDDKYKTFNNILNFNKFINTEYPIYYNENNLKDKSYYMFIEHNNDNTLNITISY
jgi:hypothetical protein